MLIQPSTPSPELAMALAGPVTRSTTQGRDIDKFLAEPVSRLLYVGDLGFQSGTADFLAGLIEWSEWNPQTHIEVWWAGNGPLRGVLWAQPLPPSLRQSFLDHPDDPDVDAMLAACHVLVVPATRHVADRLVPRALSAGLRVIGDRRNNVLRQCIRDEGSGSLFTPGSPGALARALDHVIGRNITVSAERLVPGVSGGSWQATPA